MAVQHDRPHILVADRRFSSIPGWLWNRYLKQATNRAVKDWVHGRVTLDNIEQMASRRSRPAATRRHPADIPSLFRLVSEYEAEYVRAALACFISSIVARGTQS